MPFLSLFFLYILPEAPFEKAAQPSLQSLWWWWPESWNKRLEDILKVILLQPHTHGKDDRWAEVASNGNDFTPPRANFSIDGRLDLLESSFFCGTQRCLMVVEYFLASKQPWCLTTSSEWATEYKSFNMTISFLAFITFTGPVKWFRFQDLNPWPLLNLPNIFCQEASWTFEGKVNQMGVCFPSVKAKCLQGPAGLFLSVGRGWLPRMSRGVCLW